MVCFLFLKNIFLCTMNKYQVSDRLEGRQKFSFVSYQSPRASGGAHVDFMSCVSLDLASSLWPEAYNLKKRSSRLLVFLVG